MVTHTAAVMSIFLLFRAVTSSAALIGTRAALVQQTHNVLNVMLGRRLGDGCDSPFSCQLCLQSPVDDLLPRCRHASERERASVVFRPRLTSRAQIYKSSVSGGVVSSSSMVYAHGTFHSLSRCQLYLSREPGRVQHVRRRHAQQRVRVAKWPLPVLVRQSSVRWLHLEV
jgi:hypothetical protein